ncbi:MAG: ribulokinase, partial [Eubacteriales bacterium]|nr:ribulokinase [Eubacteriales bacterium]
MANKYTIGVDFGTLSGRAVVVDITNGDELATASYDYPHAVMDEFMPDGITRLPPDFALQHPQDYLDVLKVTVPEAVKKSGISSDDIIGIGIDFTACTVMPVFSDGTPLCFTDKFRNEPQAYVKLWKHHAAQEYANRINKAAAESNQNWLNRYGGKISSEWLFPKIWQTLEESPDVYKAADFFIEAGDWVVWQLCGIQTRSSCMAGYKGIWNKKEGYPSKEFFASLDKRLENVVEDKLNCPVTPLGSKAGLLTEKASALTGLKAGIAVAICNVDAHVTVPALNITGTKKMLAIMGTSTCHMLLGDTEKIVPGMCGVVEDGILPGFFGYEAGQSCVGDHFAWLIENLMPAAYKEEADRKNKRCIAYMEELASQLHAGESGIIALDWWNGNRSVLVDVDLSGLFVGMTLATKPEELFRSLVEATAFGSRKIIETFRYYGIEVNELYAAGGIAEKSPFTMQLYADILGIDIKISGSAQAPALGSAIFAAVAAGITGGGYNSVNDACAAMGKLKNIVYKPNMRNNTVYNELYKEYEILHDYF